MKKLLIVLISIAILVVGCLQLTKSTKPGDSNLDENSTNEINEDNNTDKSLTKEDVDQIFTEFNNRFIQEVDENGKVKKFSSKSEIISFISEVAYEDLAAQYVNSYYEDREDGLYITDKEPPLLLLLNQDYELKEMTDKYHIVQNIDSEEQGKYELIATIDNLNDEWVIEDIKVDIEVARNPKNRYKKLYEKYKDILIIANKQIPLSSDFVPSELVAPDVVFRFKEDVPYRYLEAEAAYAIEDLFAAALEDEIELYGASGYRSYNTQKIVFESNVAKYGEEEANTFSARPGESEHQTGLSLDVTSRSVNMGLTQKFADTKEGKWLKENAYKHGFIIRYPKGKEDITGYMYEPWHLRYVGKEVAEIIDSNDLTLEEFLKSIDVIK